jgi:ABC-type multidrug transport system ATPase subunit
MTRAGQTDPPTLSTRPPATERPARGHGPDTKRGAMPVLRMEGLGRRFGDNWAVRDLTLDVRAGEVLGLLGPNGAGKTTTVRLLAALIAPTAGHAWVDGIEIREAPDEIRAQVGILT